LWWLDYPLDTDDVVGFLLAPHERPWRIFARRRRESDETEEDRGGGSNELLLVQRQESNEHREVLRLAEREKL